MRNVHVLSALLILLSLPASGPSRAQSDTPPETEQAPPPTDSTAAAIPVDLGEARERVREGDFEAAEKILAGLDESAADDPTALLLHGEVLLALNRPADARPLLERCVQLDPERPRVHYQLASALASVGKRDGAIDAFAKELAITEDDKVKEMAHLSRALLLQDATRWLEAAAELKQVLEIAPDRVEVHGDLALALMRSGKLAEAEDALRAGSEAGFLSARHHYNLAHRWFQAQKFEKAVTAFGHALEVDPELGEAERGLAAALDKLGRESEAVRHLRRYLELAPDAPEAERIAERVRAAGGS